MGTLIISIGIFIFLIILSFVLIKLIPELKKYLLKEKIINNNYNTSIPAFIPQQNIDQLSEQNTDKKAKEILEEEKDAEENMDRIFSVPDLDDKFQTNFDFLGKEK